MTLTLLNQPMIWSLHWTSSILWILILMTQIQTGFQIQLTQTQDPLTRTQDPLSRILATLILVSPQIILYIPK